MCYSFQNNKLYFNAIFNLTKQSTKKLYSQYNIIKYIFFFTKFLGEYLLLLLIYRWKSLRQH